MFSVACGFAGPISRVKRLCQGKVTVPRANRYHLPQYVWHITHRCHRQQFLLKFVRDRQAWIRWLYAARKRFGLCVLDYTVTANHIHLLVRDQGRGEIARSMQLVAGRTAQAYNARKNRHGAVWEDRYHCHRGRNRRAPDALRRLHRPQHGPGRHGAAPSPLAGRGLP
jgi:putative transposase